MPRNMKLGWGHKTHTAPRPQRNERLLLINLFRGVHLTSSWSYDRGPPSAIKARVCFSLKVSPLYIAI